MARRDLLDLSGVDPGDPGLQRSLASWRSMSEDELGAVLRTYRPRPGPSAVVASLVPTWIILGIGLASVGSMDRVGFWIFLGVTLGSALPGALWLWADRRHRLEIRRHGLSVGKDRHRRYAIPYATIDPGRVRVLDKATFLARFYGSGLTIGPATRRFQSGGLAGMSCLLLCGLDRTADTFTADPSLPRIPDCPGHLVGSIFGTWMISVSDPEGLLRDLEAAMVADGYPAEGLARRALDARLRLPDIDTDPFADYWPELLMPSRGTFDPPLGFRTPLWTPDGPPPPRSTRLLRGVRMFFVAIYRSSVGS